MLYRVCVCVCTVCVCVCILCVCTVCVCVYRRYKRPFAHGGDAGEKQLKELMDDEWGQRSIATARRWVVELAKQLDVAMRITTKYAYIMDDPRPGSQYTNLQLMQQGLLRLLDRLVKPHRTMLLGLRPWAFRSTAVLSSQALVNSRDFPPNFPGSPSDRRLYSARFLHIWAWLLALNNPPGYPPIPDLQDKLAEASRILKLETDERLLYVCDPVFKPKPEAQRLGVRLHIQALNLPLPPNYASEADAYYTKAIAKVDGEPCTEAGMRERAKGEKRMDMDESISDVFQGSLLLDRAGD
jgi:hypothetical protein